MAKACKQCSAPFEIIPEDLEFYSKIALEADGETFVIPEPTLCPDCRQQRRLAFRNERTLYKRRCDLSGKEIISIYAPGSKFPVYDFKQYYSDKWNALSYGTEFDFTRPFFPQLEQLWERVPVISLNHQIENINCDYANLVSNNRDCYLIFAGNENRDCSYSNYLQRCQDVVDSFFIFDSELCYECIDCYNCYDLKFSQYCQNCRESSYLYNCRNCVNCFGCVSLVGKEHCFFNEQLDRETYRSRVAKALSSKAEITAELALLLKQNPQKYYAGVNNEDISGDHVSFSKNAKHCFDCTHLEDCKYCTWLHRSKNCYDHYAWGLGGELGYENHLCGNTFYNIKFCESCWNDVSYLTYCSYCTHGSSHLFGCVGVQRQSYCILNTKYSEQDYSKLLARILRHLRDTGEFGEFYPASMSRFAYNETVAQEYYPLTAGECAKWGWSWSETLPFTTGRETIKSLPVGPIGAVQDSIVKEVLACSTCQKNYRITAPELKFYRQQSLQLPERCFDCRYKSRREKRNPRSLFKRFCEQCGLEFQSSFAPDRPDLVYCEKCYLDAVQ